jgi:hypothetical protein
MRLDEFRRVLRREINCWEINDRYTLYRQGYTIWDSDLDVEYTHKTLDDALQFEIDGVKLITILENLPNDHFRHLELNGGSGSGSGERMKMRNNEGMSTPSKRLHPSIRNSSIDKQVGNGGRAKSAQDALDNFSNAHRNSNHEYSVTTDDLGYVHSYREGKKHSVTPDLIPNMHVTHNHPSGSNFSTQDLKVFSSTQIKSITATGSRASFRVERGAKFDSKGFNQAIQRLEKRGLGIQGIKGTDTIDRYNKGLGKWLKINSKRYGYTYTATPVKG